MTIIFQYPVMFFVQIFVWYIRTFLGQSPRSLTHSLSCDRNPILSIESMKLEHGLYPSDVHLLIYTEAYVPSRYVRKKHMYAHILPMEDFFASMERSQVFTNELPLHRYTTSYNQNILKHLYNVKKDIPSRCWFGWIWLCVQVWLRRILKNTRNIHGFHKRSRTAPTYNLLQPKYSQKLILCE